MSKLNRILSIFLGVLLLASVVILMVFYLGGNVEGNEDIPQYTGLFIRWGYILLIIAVASAVLFPIFQIVMQPKSAITVLIGIAALVLIFFIGYSLSSEQLIELPDSYKGVDNEPGTLKMVGAGIYAMYFFLGLAIVGALFTEASKAFRR